jgi:predicted transcriptional regulator
MSADDVAFLVRSPNRGAVLTTLATSAADRAELRERVGVSRVTVGRITTDLERRGWVERIGTEYRATRAGRVVAAAYERFLATVDTTRRLDPLLEFLPVESFEFALTELADAEVVAPTPASPGRHLARLRDLFEASAEAWMVVHAVAPRVVASSYRASRTNGLVTRGVVTPEVIDAIRADAAVRERVHEMVDRGDMVIYERPSVPVQFGVFDETTAVSADDEAGVPRGIVVTDSSAVREWALDRFESFGEDATPLDAARFAVDADGESATDA